jgi:hypothetical protein
LFELVIVLVFSSASYLVEKGRNITARWKTDDADGCFKKNDFFSCQRQGEIKQKEKREIQSQKESEKFRST